MRINLGTFDKVEANHIRNILKYYKSVRTNKNKRDDYQIVFRSRTYGNRNNLHDRTQPIGNSEKIAVYLKVKQKENLE